MLLAPLSRPAHWQPFLSSPIFRKSLAWISAHLGAFTEGLHELGEPGWYVNVHGYTTQAPDLCTWENHLATIDIQYMIDGVEGIDLIAVEQLGEPTSFKAESDTQKFAAVGKPAPRLILRTGDFVVFLPGEAHRPKVAAGAPVALKKLVVKVPVKLVEAA
jgi:biofilm protein TabA